MRNAVLEVGLANGRETEFGIESFEISLGGNAQAQTGIVLMSDFDAAAHQLSPQAGAACRLRRQYASYGGFGKSPARRQYPGIGQKAIV